jgi:FtsH-binding integral membrane protein
MKTLIEVFKLILKDFYIPFKILCKIFLCVIGACLIIFIPIYGIMSIITYFTNYNNQQALDIIIFGVLGIIIISIIINYIINKYKIALIKQRKK